MKLSSIRIDSARLEGGEWVGDIPGLPGLRVKVRGIDNRDYLRLRARLSERIPIEDRDEYGPSAAASDVLFSTLIARTILVDWEGMETEASTAAAPEYEPYTAEAAAEYLANPDYVTFRDGVAWAADQVATRARAKREADAKN